MTPADGGEPVAFYSEGVALVGDLHRPGPGGAPNDGSPVVVVCSGFGGNKELTARNLVAPLLDAGFAVLRFDYRGFGASAGERWRLVPWEQVEDIRSAVRFVRQQECIDAERVGLYGVSFGGGTAIVAAALDTRIRCVVAQTPVTDGRRWLRSLRPHWQWLRFEERLRRHGDQRALTGQSEWVDPEEVMPSDPDSLQWREEVVAAFPERRFRLPLESAERIIEFSPLEHIDRLGERPLLVIAVEGDCLVPTEQAAELHARARGPKRYMVVRGRSHHDITSGPGLAEVAGQAAGWLAAHLGPVP